MDCIDLYDKIAALRGGIEAVFCIQAAMRECGSCSDTFGRGLYYVAEHLQCDLDALLHEITESREIS